MLRVKYLYFMRAHNEVGEFPLETRRFHDVVVNPVVIAAARLAEQDAVILETVLFKPVLRDFTMRLGAGSEEEDDVPVLEPFVDDFQRIGVRRHDAHALRFFIGHVVADGAVNINEKILLTGRQNGADGFPLFVVSGYERRLQVILHSEMNVVGSRK